MKFQRISYLIFSTFLLFTVSSYGQSNPLNDIGSTQSSSSGVNSGQDLSGLNTGTNQNLNMTNYWSNQQNAGGNKITSVEVPLTNTNNLNANCAPTNGGIALSQATVEPSANNGHGSVKCEYATSKDTKSKKSAGGPCQQAYDHASSLCSASGYTQVGQQVLSGFSQQKAAGNIKEACESAKKVAELGLVANGGFAVACYQARSDCMSTCDSNPDEEMGKLEPSTASAACNKMITNVLQSSMQVANDAAAYGQSELCAKGAGECLDQTAYDDPNCQQYCMKPGRQSDPKCQLAISNCSNAAYAASNPSYCACVSNPTGSGCPGYASTASPSSGNLFDGMPSADAYGTNAKNLAATPQNNNGSNSPSGYNPGNGSGSAPIGGPDASKAAAEAVNKDILLGSGGGGAGGYFGGGGGGYADGAGGKAGAGGGAGLDLKAFLPGGKNDPSRNPASIGMISAGITSANGLTNFQKVTRKLNEKRPEMMP